jgi:hypothetical protein
MRSDSLTHGERTNFFPCIAVARVPLHIALSEVGSSLVEEGS